MKRYPGRRPVSAHDGVAQPDADGPPAILALLLRSLFADRVNTQAGLLGIYPAIIESARDVCLRGREVFQVELPLATRSVMAEPRYRRS